jgi:hypothetical protein
VSIAVMVVLPRLSSGLRGGGAARALAGRCARGGGGGWQHSECFGQRSRSCGDGGS